MNARRSPGRILGNRTEDQGANLFADTLPSSYLSDSGEPCPIQTKPRSMPVQDGSWSDQNERLPPPGPARSQRRPRTTCAGQSSSRNGKSKHPRLSRAWTEHPAVRTRPPLLCWREQNQCYTNEDKRKYGAQQIFAWDHIVALP